MSTTSRLPLGRLRAVVDEIGAVDPIYLTTSEKQELLVEAARARARLQAIEMKVLAVGDDIAEATGDRSTAAWLATKTRDAHGAVRATAKLAVALETRWTQVQAAFAAGEVNLAQVRVIDKALTDLPQDLGDDLISKAEGYLVTEAAHLGPRELAILGDRVLEYVAPDTADQADYQRLLDQERRAAAVTRLTLRRRGDGSTDLHARIPDLAASRLRTYLNAFTAPRRHHQHSDRDEFAQLPLHRQQGIAFVALLERVLKSDLPRHGGKATSLAVLIDHDTLVADLTAAGIALTSTGDKITAGQTRRLACQAGILPAVLGGESEVLDLGRAARLLQARSAHRHGDPRQDLHRDRLHHARRVL